MRNFMSRVQVSDGCWNWGGGRTQSGYGQVWSGRRYAHRVSYEMHVGPIPAGLLVLHRCDNPLCVNPSHLFLGTNADNMRDKASKGRCSRTGAKRKISAKQAAEIRASEELTSALANRFGISTRQVRLIRQGSRWQDATTANYNVP